MPPPDSRPTLMDRTGLIMALAIVAVLAPVGYFLFDPSDARQLEFDGLMRLLAVQDLVRGQGWYDSVQYRVLPPEGLNLHWSRLVDAPIAALLLTFQALIGAARAEALVLVLWPALVHLAFVFVTFKAAQVGFGAKAASFAALVAAIYPLVTIQFFASAQLDHHNVQLVCNAIVIWAILVPGGGWRAGLAAGAAAALSLAVGLEMAPVILLGATGLTLFLVLDGDDHADRLAGFGAGLLFATPVLFVLQTPVADWRLGHCDELAWPALVAAGALSVFALAVPRLLRNRPGRGRRFGLAAALAAGLIALAFPVLVHCRTGPYALVDPLVREMVIDRVIENQSIVDLMTAAPGQMLTLVLPFVSVVIMLLLSQRGAGPERGARLLILACMLLGLIGIFFQFRLAIWGFVVFPLALGVVFSDVVRNRLGLPPVLSALVTLVVLFPPLFAGLITAPFADVRAKVQPADIDCFDRSALEPLAALPTTTVFTTLNLGPPVLKFTDHAVTSASYHRSPKALSNGVLPFLGDAAGLTAAMREAGADLVVVCAAESQARDGTIWNSLTRSDATDGFERVDDGTTDLRIYRPLPRGG